MENDFRNDPSNPPSNLYDPLKRDKIRESRSPGSMNGGFWLSVAAVVAIALAAYMTFGSTEMSRTQDKPAAVSETMGQLDTIEPAEGDAFTNKKAAPDELATAPPAAVTPPVVTTAPVEPQAVTAPNTYASEEDCKAATNTACHFMTCDQVPEGKQPDEACGPDFKKGWQPVVPAVDTTTVPEEVAPPMMGEDDVDQMRAPPSSAPTP